MSLNVARRATRRVQGVLGATLLSVALLPGGFAAPLAACAGGSAALVVDLGDQGDVLRFCVSLPDDSVSGLELIQLASQQHGLQYRLGHGGQAVCQLQGVGPDGDDCFADYPDFWGYWHGDGSGGWNWSGSGAGSYRVEAGDVEGWSWGSGQDGSTHPAPPITTFASVCGSAPAPKPSPTRAGGAHKGGAAGGGSARGGGGSGDGSGSPSGGGAAAEGTASSAQEPGEGDRERPSRKRGRHDRRDRPHKRGRARSADERPLASPAAVLGDAAENITAAPGPDEDTPPVAGVVALSAAGLVLAGGTLAARRRRKA